MTTARGLRIGDAVFGIGTFCLGLFLAVETILLGAGPGYAVIGPRAFPAGVAIGLLLLGALELRAAWKTPHDGEVMQLDWTAFGWVAIALIVQLVLLKWVGWIPAAALLFFAVARAFGSRSVRANVAIGLAMSVSTFVIFNYVLGLSLPWGVLFDPFAKSLGLS